MHDQNIGQHCSIDTCRQKDWLPVSCKYCHKFYCADHSSIDSHNCPQHHKTSNQVYQCPFCNLIINVNNHLSLEENLSIHQAIDCKQNYKDNITKDVFCSQRCCHTKLKTLNSFRCKQCRLQFCSKHRLIQGHSCVK